MRQNGGGAWQRIFDFGTNSSGEDAQGTGLNYLYLTPSSGSGVPLSAHTARWRTLLA